MKEIYAKRISRRPDLLPSRNEKGVEVDYLENGTVSDIFIVDNTGKKAIDLNGNVKDSYSETITAAGTTKIDSTVYGEDFTSVKEVSVNVSVEAAKTIAHSATGTTTVNVPVSADLYYTRYIRNL